MSNKTGSGWKTWAAAAAAMAFGFFAVIALAQTTGGSSGGTSGSTSGGHSSGGGVGVGISVDVTKLFSPDSHETRPANEWDNLHNLPGPNEGSHGIVVFNPDPDPLYPRGVQVMLDDRGHTLAGGELVPPEGPMVQLAPPPATSCPEAKPCPEAAELEQLKATNAALQKQIDDLKSRNGAQASAATVCEEKQKDCEKKLAAAQSQIAALQAQLSAAQTKLTHPGDGAKAIFVPFSVTYHNDKEIIHYGWDIIRAVFDGNTLRVENHTEEWIKNHPELPQNLIDWLRANYGGIPPGQIDFGNALFEGETLRDRIEHLCEPEPSQAEVMAKKSVSHILGVHYNKSTQSVTATSNGAAIAVSGSNVKETAFDLDLTAECIWTYDAVNHVLKKKVTVTLAVQYQDKDGKTQEVKYEADDPQIGYILKG